MIDFFRRVFKFAESEAHAAINKLEDPIKMTEQGIRDLKKDLQVSLKNLAEVKALQIRMQRDLEEKKAGAADYEKKAMLLLQQARAGALEPAEADRLAGEVLAKKERAASAAVGMTRDVQKQDAMVAQLEANVKQLKSQISAWETELATLIARAKVASATKKLNQQLAQVDSNGTIAMLEKMRTRVDEDEALAKSYGEIAMVETSIDAEIDKTLAGSRGEVKASDSLAALKAKMGIS